MRNRHAKPRYTEAFAKLFSKSGEYAETKADYTELCVTAMQSHDIQKLLPSLSLKLTPKDAPKQRLITPNWV